MCLFAIRFFLQCHAQRIRDAARSADRIDPILSFQHFKSEPVRPESLLKADFHQGSNRQVLVLKVIRYIGLRHKTLVKDCGNRRTDVKKDGISLPDPCSLLPVDQICLIKRTDDIVKFRIGRDDPFLGRP